MAMGRILNCREATRNGGSSLPAASIHDSERTNLNASDFNWACRISAIYIFLKGVLFPRNCEILSFSTYHFLP